MGVTKRKAGAGGHRAGHTHKATLCHVGWKATGEGPVISGWRPGERLEVRDSVQGCGVCVCRDCCVQLCCEVVQRKLKATPDSALHHHSRS